MNIESLKTYFDSMGLIEGEKVFNRNDIIIKLGEPVKYLYWIESGAVRAFLIDDKAEEQNIRFGYKGDLITVLSSVFSGKSSDLYLQSLKRSKVKIVSLSKLADLKKSDQEFSRIWVSIIENLVCQQMEREIDLLTQDPKLRYMRVLERSPQLFQEISSRHIANYLRMTPETLSRIRKS
jgi:CRP-like cAMP-binding protein